ncbi:MAG TPA: UvrD-helicase domain-containing protein [Steroidobacteraceae bacterium]|nr:UvrD-helicase domain-containing protein [Steroidobacteraceae bacterium]
MNSADELARERASDPRHSILLQAPAGSGKTSVLARRLLRLLAEVDTPEEILAITFTRKAAAEMRARVVQALRGPTEQRGPDAERLGPLAAAALERSRARGWNLADDPGRLHIQTIDAFNFRLASQLPVGAGAGGALHVTEAAQPLYLQAARRTLVAAESDADLSADVELLFERLDNRWNNVERLLAEMLRQRVHWLRYVLGHEPRALCERIDHTLANIVSEQLQSLQRVLPPGLRAEAAALPEVGVLGSSVECLGSWKRLAALALTLKGDWRSPRALSRNLGAAYEAAAARDALRECIERLSRIAGAQQALLETLALPPAELAASDAAALGALSRVLRTAAAHLQAEFTLTGRVDHTYIAGAARAALVEAGQPTDLALRIGLSLRHILVDEFQDTSLAQFDLLETLTAGWQSGDGRSLFIVGDPMQSIYQFREAEVGLFLRARDHGIGGLRLETLRLTRNFRSQPALIAWTNDTFQQLFPAADDLRASAVAFAPSVAAQAPAPDASRQAVVALQLFADAERSAEAVAIAERIAELREQDARATVAVLVAARAHAAPILNALEARHIEAIGIDLIALRDLSIIRDLVALTRALHHLGDRTAWLTVLRAPWCGVSLATLTELSRRHDPRVIWEALGEEMRLAACRADDRARLARVRTVLAEALSRDRTVLADWLEGTWLRLGAADAYPKQELRHARAFFAMLAERAGSGEWRGPQDLDAMLADLYAQPQVAGANPVQIMTIHRAKGLEFDHVFVPALDRDLNRGGEPLLRWLDLPRPQGASDLLMAPVPAIGAERQGDVGTYLKRLMGARALHEQLRLLYVAVTRSRKTLHLSAIKASQAEQAWTPRSGTLLACLWPALQSQFVCRAADASASVAVRTPVLRHLASDWASPPLERAPELWHLPLAQESLEPPEFSWVRETFRLIGIVVHGELQKLGATRELPPRSRIEAERALYAQQLRHRGVAERDLPYATQVVTEALARTVSDERGRWLFSAEHRESHSELALTGMAAGRLTNVVIDRCFVDRDGIRWVVDFKTSRHEGGGLEAFLAQELQRYRPQLHTYAELARALGPQPVRVGLYFPLLGVFCELD